jgi:hypothetical protein
MPAAKDLTDLGRLIAAQHDWPVAKAFKSYKMSDADRAVITTSAVSLLRIFPDAPNAGAQLSAAFAVQLERALPAPVQVIAGTLKVEGKAVFSGHFPIDRPAILSTGELRWGGHVWVMVGSHIVDIAIFRAAYSRHGPSTLSRHVDLAFGRDKALYVDDWKHSRRMGLGYEPHHVLSGAEITALMGGAYRRIEANAS